MAKAINPVWAEQIRNEAASLDANEEHLHNRKMHQSILETWRRDSPIMWGRLELAKLADPLAKVLQARMWDRQAELMEAGLPVTDAREQAEAEILMLEPEKKAGDRLPAAPEAPLPA